MTLTQLTLLILPARVTTPATTQATYEVAGLDRVGQRLWILEIGGDTCLEVTFEEAVNFVQIL